MNSKNSLCKKLHFKQFPNAPIKVNEVIHSYSFPAFRIFYPVQCALWDYHQNNLNFEFLFTCSAGFVLTITKPFLTIPNLSRNGTRAPYEILRNRLLYANFSLTSRKILSSSFLSVIIWKVNKELSHKHKISSTLIRYKAVSLKTSRSYCIRETVLFSLNTLLHTWGIRDESQFKKYIPKTYFCSFEKSWRIEV